MPKLRRLLMIVITLVLTRAPATLAGAPSLETLVHLIDVREARINPAGDRVAFVAADSLDPTLFQIWTVDTDGESRPRPFTAGGRSAREPAWSPDGRSLLFLSARGHAPEQMQIVGADGTGSVTLTEEPAGVLAMAWSADGTYVAYLSPGVPKPPGDPIDATVAPPPVRLRVREMKSGETWTVSPDSLSVWQFQWSPVEARLAVTATRPGPLGEWRRGLIATVDGDGSGWRRLPGRADPIGSIAWSPDGRRLAYYALPGDAGGEPVAVVAAPREAEREPGRLFPSGWRGTSGELAWSDTVGLVVAESEGIRSFITRVDPDLGGRVRLAERWGGAGTSASRLTIARNGAIAYTSDGPDHPADVFVLDAGSTTPRRLTWMNAQLEAHEWPEPARVAWSATDGAGIEGILVLPDSTAGGPLPLVVLAHGGPSAHWNFRFFGDPHYPALLLALRGYAVLLPNPRGSTGYGEEFQRLNDGQPGERELGDIASGIDSLVTAGIVDSGRIGIGGFSYGATLAAWALSRSSTYRCAVLGSGLYDFRGGLAGSDLTPYWPEECGTLPGSLEPFLGSAPIYYVGNVRRPVLLLHGAEDTRTPLSQSLDYYRGLQGSGNRVEFFIYPREGHRIAEPAHLIDLSRRQLEWYERYLR